MYGHDYLNSRSIHNWSDICKGIIVLFKIVVNCFKLIYTG